jgi:haloacetate dehalogenase
MEELYGDVVAIWRTWADEVHGIPLDSGHHVAKEAPDSLAAALLDFQATPRHHRLGIPAA